VKIIKRVTNEGISYIDDSGSQGYVDFKQCNENWIQYRKRSENLSEERVIELRKRSKCVGQRDICASLGLLGFLLNLLQDLSLLSVMSIPTLKRLFASCKMISFLLDGQH